MLVIVIYYVTFFLVLTYGFYFTITGIVGCIKTSKYKKLKPQKENYFAILIPARNEEKVIGNLIDSLNHQNYPKEKYQIYVIPNHCTDHTKEIALSYQAKILNCTVPTKTKGDVLKFAFQHFKNQKEIDAYLIFDADNIAHPDFLTQMNIALENGYRVAQGYRSAKNPSDNWLSGSYCLFYLIQNVFFNRSRMGLDGSASINGTGFMIQKSFLDQEGFETYTLTEDVEFTGQCALKNEKIAFVEQAITYDEYPNQFIPSWKQRKRWSAGVIECSKLYSWKLFKNFFKTKKIASLDMSLVYLGPIMQIIGFLDLGMLILFRYLGIHLNDFFSYIFAYGWFSFLIAYFLGILIELFVVYYKKMNPKSILSGIFCFSIFIFTWVPINILCLLKKQTEWDSIQHNRNITISDIAE